MLVYRIQKFNIVDLNDTEKYNQLQIESTNRYRVSRVDWLEKKLEAALVWKSTENDILEFK